MATSGQLTFDQLLLIARRTGIENWVDPATGKRGQVIAAPSSHRGQNGSMGSVVGTTRHHTGTPEDFNASSDYPTYQVVKEGRSGLENSLSAFGLGRWFGIYVFSEFLSWHAGAWSYLGITDGNGHFLGIEAEGTGARWTAFQREFYPRLCASILLFLGEGVDMMPRHADGAVPYGRKTDAANLPADFTSDVQGYLDNPSTLAYGATTPPDEEDLLAAIKIAVVFASPADGPDAQAVYECSMLNCTRVRLKDPQTVADRQHWLTKCGIPWSEVGEVGRIDAFGVDITPAGG